MCVAEELTEVQPAKRVRLLGEDLVVYRGEDGSYGLIAEQCAHRKASLFYGFVEGCAIRCPYHGWVYDQTGQCLETPFEPPESLMKRTVILPAYPVQRVAGLLFAYLGPQPAPMLPRWDVWFREDGTHHISVQPVINTNWLQAQENSLDPVHVYYLHGHTLFKKGLNPGNNYRPIEAYDFERIPEGIVKRRIYGGDGLNEYTEPGHPAVFPTILRHHIEGRDGINPFDGTMAIDMHLRIPIDDTHTQVIWLGFNPSADGSTTDPRTEVPTVEYVKTLWDEQGNFHMRTYPSQDSCAWVTQGPIVDRSTERLGVSDRGIVMWRQLLEEQIAVVDDGGDPINVYRDADPDQLIEFSPTRLKMGDRYVPRDSEEARGWQEYMPGSREKARTRQAQGLAASSRRSS